MNSELGFAVIVGFICLIIVVLFLVWVVSSYIATALGLQGIVWWAVSIILFLVINSIIGGVSVNK